MTARAQRRTVLALAIGLLISVCLNLFAAGAWFTGDWLDRRAEATVDRTLRAYPPALRRDVARRLFADRRAMRAAVADLRDARQRMFALMRAEPLDRDALARAMAELRAATAALQVRLHEALAASVERASPDERRSIRAPASGPDALDGRDL